jgi:uncharacterized protein (DUF58 family)
VPIPSTRAIWLVALGLAWPLTLGGGRSGLLAMLAWDALVLLLAMVDHARAARVPGMGRAPGVGLVSAERRMRVPLTAFVPNRISLGLRSVAARPLSVSVADAPPPGFESIGHRCTVTMAALGPGPGEGAGEASVEYTVTPRSRGRHAFGDVHLRILGPLGLAWRSVRLPMGQEVAVYPESRAVAAASMPDASVMAMVPDAGRAARAGRVEGREFAALRHYLAGDDIRSVDWKVTARRGWPVVREWQPERNQTVWVLIDCGRHLGVRLGDGRTKLDRAVEAALALARSAAERGDRIGAILFGAEVERVVPPEAGTTRLGPLAQALYLAKSRPVEADYGAAFDELLARQRRRALVVVFTELSDPDTTALLLSRAQLLRRRHVVAVAAISDADLVEVATARPTTGSAALARAAAERIVEERDAAARRLAAAGVAVITTSAASLSAAVVTRYAAVKERGLL